MAESLYVHAPFYRMLHKERSADLPFYLEATEGRDTVLEYGVGYGRVALPMARRGQRVVGVDDSAAMLASLADDLKAESADVRERVRAVQGDARELSLGSQFDAVTCPFNGISHHHSHEQLAAFLGRVRQHLSPDGIFAFDVAVPSPTLLAGSSTEFPWFRDPVDGAVCRGTESTHYDAVSQVLTITTTTRTMEEQREPVQMVLRLRQLFPAETMLLLHHHGWHVLERRLSLGDVIGYVCRPDPDSGRV